MDIIGEFNNIIDIKQLLKKNLAANETYVQKHYPNEIFLSDSEKYQDINNFTKTIVIPKNVKIAESRIPTLEKLSGGIPSIQG